MDVSCVPMANRCDGRVDCHDKSDEIECDQIVIDMSYLDDVPAPPRFKNRLTEVNVR